MAKSKKQTYTFIGAKPLVTKVNGEDVFLRPGDAVEMDSDVADAHNERFEGGIFEPVTQPTDAKNATVADGKEGGDEK